VSICYEAVNHLLRPIKKTAPVGAAVLREKKTLHTPFGTIESELDDQ
jgi:hypothetical protein